MDQPHFFKPYILTPLDHSTAPVHFSGFVSFLCQDPSQGLSILEKGVQRLTTLLPFISGNLVQSSQPQGAANVFEVQPADPFHLIKQPMLRTKLHEQCISPHNASRYCPALCCDDLFNPRYMPLPFDIPASEPQPLCRIQANMMTDGIVLCVSVHHFACDAAGALSIVRALSECCCNPELLPERLFSSPEREAQSRTTIFQSTNETHSPVYHDYGSYTWKAGPSADLGAPISRQFCLDAEKIRKLREACIATINAGNYWNDPLSREDYASLSNNEVVTALIWLCGERARSAATTTMEKGDSFLTDHNSTLLVAVDARGILNIPNTYTGNAVVTNQTAYHFEGTELDDSVNTCGSKDFNPNDIKVLTNLALSVQKIFKAVDHNYVRNVISHIMASENWYLPAMPGDLTVSSLRRMRVYDLDFGPCLGKPCDVDIPDNRTDGLCWIKPARPKSASWEVRLTLNQVAMECLGKDRLWRQLTSEEAYYREGAIRNKL